MTSAYPLQWPPGWPRTHWQKRKSWRNVVKIAKALGLKLDRLADCDD